MEKTRNLIQENLNYYTDQYWKCYENIVEKTRKIEELQKQLDQDYINLDNLKNETIKYQAMLDNNLPSWRGEISWYLNEQRSPPFNNYS